MSKPVNILFKYWAYKSFRPLQEEIVYSILSGKDTLAILPTGGGKSICFQIPGISLGGVTLVISPLISLMNDQVDNLRKKGISALAMHSGLTKRETEIEYVNLRNGKYQFLYVSPERIQTERFKEALHDTDIRLLAIDEAHCISQWGHDFRPEYLLISEIRALLKCPCIALTASATEKVQADIRQFLNFGKDVGFFKQTVVRPNLSYVVLNEEDKNGRLIKICSKIKGTGIVYANNRKKTVTLANLLVKSGFEADFYHAGIDYEEKIKRQSDWQSGKTRIVVCTNAFGMGIDKSNVRFVVHYDLPLSPEAYYQEAGRAGRDGNESWCILMYNNTDKVSALEKLEFKFLDKTKLERIFSAICNHNQIPIGAGFEENYQYNAHDIQAKYNFKSTELHVGMDMLQREGLIKLSDAYSNPSRLRIIVGNEEIYAFYLKHPKYELLVKTILRMYGGLFDNYLEVSEFDISRNLSFSINKIKEMMLKLNALKLFDYIPQNDLPTFALMVPRPAKISYDKKKWDFLKESAKERLNAMIQYSEKAKCRQVLLANYFGETEAKLCGKCDDCRKRKVKPDEQLMKVKQILKAELNGKSLSLEKISAFLQDEPEKLEAMRQLMDNGIILKNSEGEYTWKVN